MAAAEEPRTLKAILRALPPIEDTFSEKGRRWFRATYGFRGMYDFFKPPPPAIEVDEVNQFLTYTVQTLTACGQETGTLALQAFQSMLPFC
eukprot:CAMPEP_0175990132 /NCGR_PEP_ID=MMETSP0108-20121206/52134_1 /TAXON_ID=195067 ORGANISM="Goniomonas pacifica, Strain CCMP1869" /NCGR_SAMPLE_ID=MMETSP0108 /ASSEMBLY_ACC=CAM_ASM_000204 /LENGTH=90 /DNA_ID=CAMNT_0017321565 /DNA_START=116 /DNA_END=385 /DNA_ORIENTATION=-